MVLSLGPAWLNVDIASIMIIPYLIDQSSFASKNQANDAYTI